ncbi:hypothetical protein CEB3_c21230 [Peptococcaceae bacterium CEB3]|nr:hypothetical protein CEB3_c21230 [Peptococcaceae bacterium CEB3]
MKRSLVLLLVGLIVAVIALRGTLLPVRASTTPPVRADPAAVQPQVHAILPQPVSTANQSSEVGKTIAFDKISTISDKSYYLYFFSPT